MNVDRRQIARECYDAYESGNREPLERHLADDFVFFSPADPGIGRADYFERCWPNAARIDSYTFVRLIDSGNEVIVTYEARRVDGTSFRNTEVLSFSGEKVSRAEVYFGWDLPSG